MSFCEPLWLWLKKCSISFSRKNPLLPSQYNFKFDLYWLNCGVHKTTRGGLGKTALSIGEFCTCWCTLFNISKTICNAGWKVNTRVILSSWYFGRFLRLLLSFKFTFWISGHTISDLYPLSVNHDSKSNNFCCKSTSFEQICFIWKAWPYGTEFL